LTSRPIDFVSKEILVSDEIRGFLQHARVVFVRASGSSRESADLCDRSFAGAGDSSLREESQRVAKQVTEKTLNER